MLDEVLGLLDLGIITTEDIIHLIEMKEGGCRLVLTGRKFPEKLLPYADIVTNIDLEKDIEDVDS